MKLEFKNEICPYSFIAIILLSGCLFFYNRPHLNWDSLAYMGTLLELDGKNKNEIHDSVYINLKTAGEKYHFLTNEDNYKKDMFASEEAFYQQLPFYRVKPLYILTCYAFYRLGIPLTKAVVFPSILSFLLVGILFFHWLNKYLSTFIALGITILLMFSPAVMLTSRLATPDGLSVLLLFFGFFGFLEEKKYIYYTIFFCLSIFARPDNIIFIILILVSNTIYNYVKDKNFYKKEYILPLSFVICSYSIIQLFIEHYSWYTLFYHTFIEKISYPNSFVSEFSVEIYIKGIIQGILSLQYSFTYLPIFILILLLSLRNLKLNSMDTLIALSVLISVFVRFLLFPDFTDRFYFIYYLISLILVIKSITNKTVNKYVTL
ncbi:hypothetical protein [Chondrinema litorale]|uniref:hypothetical protein n=1 Tax=Chondrinema litorale TaxID=2994555 RepID=UPI00254358FB|nr:hypothetical protein [Chondrinema litorale]UZS00128.1 hypothetical protein OQ292_39920 [Chondrinema litorale]